MFGKKKIRGIALIDEVAGRFDDMVEELNAGIDDCVAEQGEIIVTIDQLRNRRNVLQKSVDKANRIATNLRSILGE